MGVTRAERDRKERERRDAAWRAEEERVRKLGDLFNALPERPQKAALQDAMTDRIIDLYNNVRFEHGDVLLEFLPNEYARRLLDWYFDEDGPDTFSATPTAGEDEAAQSGQVQGKPQQPGGTDGLCAGQAASGLKLVAC